MYILTYYITLYHSTYIVVSTCANLIAGYVTQNTTGNILLYVG